MIDVTSAMLALASCVIYVTSAMLALASRVVSLTLQCLHVFANRVISMTFATLACANRVIYVTSAMFALANRLICLTFETLCLSKLCYLLFLCDAPKSVNGFGSKWGRHQIHYLIIYFSICGHMAMQRNSFIVY